MSDASKLPLNALRVFAAVADRLSFTEAARDLDVTPAAVSAQIKTLEDVLETPLFYRHSRSVRLTPYGTQLLPGVQRGLDELARAIDQLRKHRSSGQLNISLLSSFLQKWLLPRLSDFYRQCPELDLRFNASRGLVDFAHSDFHAAVRYGSGQWPDLRAEHVMDEWVFPVASPALLKQLGPVNTVGDLNKYPLLHSQHEPWSDWMRRLGGDTTRLEHGPVLEDSVAALNAAELGQGLVLARWSLVADDLAAGRLVRVGTQSVRQKAAYYLVAPPEHFALPKLQRFHAWLQACCQQFQPPEGERLEPAE
jgi:LysR family transcriptional regulator, glycine cleavage system transcriptional activator